MEHFFFPNSDGDLSSDAHQSQIIGGDADVDHTQIIGGYSQIIGRDISPPGFGTPVCTHFALVLFWVSRFEYHQGQ